MRFFLLGLSLLILPLHAAETDTLRHRALAGNADAAFRLAMEYYAGTPERPRNAEVAVYWFRRAAELGSVPARYDLGACYEHGIGVEKSRIQAFREYEKAARAGLVQAILAHARLLRQGCPEEHTADRSTPGIAADPAKAESIYRQLCTPGSVTGVPEAQRCLAEMLLEKKISERTRENMAEAVRLLRSAASGGDVIAKRELADCYLTGMGVAPEPNAAAKLLKAAAAGGDAEAALRLSRLLEYGIGIAPDEEAAFRFCKQAAEAGNAAARARLGDFYWSGKSVKQDIFAAVRLYRQAADAGDGYGKYRLARAMLDGIGVARDSAGALRLLQESANQEERLAQFELAMLYRRGLLVPQDLSAAVYWFGRAARRGLPGAMREYGNALISGTGIKADPKQGRAWIIRAARSGDTEARRMIEQGR